MITLNPYILDVPMDSTLGRAAVELIDEYHDRRLCQDSLDLYRGNWRYVVDTVDTLIMLVAISAGNVVGVSACLLKNGQTLNSITVVRKSCRRMGIGSQLMQYKAELVSALAPDVYMDTRVSTSNDFSIKACQRAGLKPIASTTEVRDGRTFNFVTMSNRNEPAIEIPQPGPFMMDYPAPKEPEKTEKVEIKSEWKALAGALNSLMTAKVS